MRHKKVKNIILTCIFRKHCILASRLARSVPSIWRNSSAVRPLKFLGGMGGGAMNGMKGNGGKGGIKNWGGAVCAAKTEHNKSMFKLRGFECLTNVGSHAPGRWWLSDAVRSVHTPKNVERVGRHESCLKGVRPCPRGVRVDWGSVSGGRWSPRRVRGPLCVRARRWRRPQDLPNILRYSLQ